MNPQRVGALTFEDLPSDEQLARDESGMTYRLLYWRLWLDDLALRRQLRTALDTIAILEASVTNEEPTP